jgi:hypothetical protein
VLSPPSPINPATSKRLPPRCGLTAKQRQVAIDVTDCIEIDVCDNLLRNFELASHREVANLTDITELTASPAINVAATLVKRALVSGLGAVQTLNSVCMKSRVDGQIIKIAFIESKDDRAGDKLAEIDADDSAPPTAGE